jgi:hypothetical protein
MSTETILLLCGVEAKVVSDGHHHDGAQNSGSLIEVRLCTRVKVWRFDYCLTTLSMKSKPCGGDGGSRDKGADV